MYTMKYDYRYKINFEVWRKDTLIFESEIIQKGN